MFEKNSKNLNVRFDIPNRLGGTEIDFGTLFQNLKCRPPNIFMKDDIELQILMGP